MSGSYANLLCHAVFSTKNRIDYVRSEFQADLYRYISGIIQSEEGTAIQIGGTANHVHLFLKLRPTQAVSDMLRLVKANSSKWLNETVFTLKKFGWQDGYAAFSVSASQADRVRKYILSQEAHHRVKTFQDELLALFEKHRIEYDERYVWK